MRPRNPNFEMCCNCLKPVWRPLVYPVNSAGVDQSPGREVDKD